MLLGSLTLGCVLSCAVAVLLNDATSLQIELDQERAARQELQSLVLKLEDRLSLIESSINSECTVQCPSSVHKSVSFMAQLSADLANPVKGHVVVFDDVITNEGAAYNPLNGTFTAPQNGTYNFNLVATGPPSTTVHLLHLFIKKNGVETGYVFLDQNDKYYLRRTTDVTVTLAAGDEICVEVDYTSGTHRLTGCCFHTHFSGFLIA